MHDTPLVLLALRANRRQSVTDGVLANLTSALIVPAGAAAAAAACLDELSGPQSGQKKTAPSTFFRGSSRMSMI